MFRNLKQKLGESLANSPARNLLSADQAKQVSVCQALVLADRTNGRAVGTVLRLSVCL